MTSRRFAFTALLLCCLLLAACVNRLPASRLEPRLQHQGFSASRPPNDSWFLNLDEQTPATLLFRREPADAAHTFFFSVELSRLSREPASNEDFADLVREKMVAVTDPERHEVLSYDATPTARQGQFCVRYQMLSLDKKSPVHPGTKLFMNFVGIACRHPLWSNSVLEMFYSERSLVSERDPALDDEGEQLLRGITIEIEPGVPAT